MTKIRFLSAEDISSIFSMRDAIDAVQEGFTALSSGRANVPLRTHMEIESHSGTALFMPVYIDGLKYFGQKVVNIYPENRKHGLNAIHALVSLFDVKTGKPAAVMDGEYLTAMRTGAASGLAADLLAKKDADTLAVIGAGVQGRTQIEGVCAVRSIKRVYVFDSDNKRAEEFAHDIMKKAGIETIPSKSRRDLKNCNVICTATTSRSPVFSDDEISEGVHINGVGSYKPDMREIPAETIVRSKVIVDSRQACLKEAGDLIQPIAEGVFYPERIYGEIGEIASGIKKGRVSDTEITLFKSVGNAVQDIAAADAIMKKAIELDAGVEIEL